MHPNQARLRFALKAILFVSGACSLAYQIVWFRELKLIFGASTSANAAVVAIFIAGLGLGGWYFGRRADRMDRPLRLYANLELGAALGAVVSPLMISFAASVYRAIGGQATLGHGALAARLLLSILVLGPPTFLMGGGFPAAIRALRQEATRSETGTLYGANTLGAVTGAFLANFILLERLGNHNTILSAALLNLVIAIALRALDRGQDPTSTSDTEVRTGHDVIGTRGLLVLGAAFVTGFSFFSMEMIWYRVFAPLLGGSVYTFGTILVLVLLGIGGGALFYGIWSRGRNSVSPSVLALTLSLEATAILIPFVASDALVSLAVQIRTLSVLGFWWLAASWFFLAGIAVLPAALATGFQFPLMIALLGRGRDSIGHHAGTVYGLNTIGGIAGALFVGMGGLSNLGANRCWLLATSALILCSIAICGLGLFGKNSRITLTLASALTVVALILSLQPGPGSYWRHSSVGAGRLAPFSSRNQLLSYKTTRESTTLLTRDGVESTIGVIAADGLSLVVNGKSDGNSLHDSFTQVMLGLLPALLHGQPETALVVGLGTGSSTGWLAEVPSVKTVRSVELEPAVLEAARLMSAVNFDVAEHPKVEHVFGDAREVLTTATQRYDVIATEPSNPYRAGVASLYTKEFYEAAKDRLAPGGILAQWTQAYEIDAASARTILATLAAVFQHVEIWTTGSRDLLLVASDRPRVYRYDDIAERIQREPFRSALRQVWLTDTVEGVFSHFIATGELARSLLDAGVSVNTDDRMFLEFGFARSVGKSTERQMIPQLRKLVAATPMAVPPLEGDLDTELLHMEVESQAAIWDAARLGAQKGPEKVGNRVAALKDAVHRRSMSALRRWETPPRNRSTYVERWFYAEALSHAGDSKAMELIKEFRNHSPHRADVLAAQYAVAKRNLPDVVEALDRVTPALRTDPWVWIGPVTARTLEAVKKFGTKSSEHADRLVDYFAEPYVHFAVDGLRILHHLALSERRGWLEHCVDALERYEPSLPWTGYALERRAKCYEHNNHPLKKVAREELAQFEANTIEVSLDR